MKNVIFLVLYFFATYTMYAQKASKHFTQSRENFLNPHSGKVMVIAHRGVHNDFAENSMAAFKKGIETGIDAVEMDIRHTKDSILVLMHDRTVDRTTNGKGAVDALTFNEIKKLRLVHNGKITNEHVPTFEEALQQLNGKILIDLDIKTPLFSKVVEMVEKYKAVNNVFFLIYDIDLAQQLKKRSPSFLTLVRTDNTQHEDSVLKVLHSEAIHIDEGQNQKELISKIKSYNSRVFINSLGDIDKRAALGDLRAFDEVLKNGANMIQTDYPELLKKFIDSKDSRH